MENTLKAALSALCTANLWSAMAALDDVAETAGPVMTPVCIFAAIGVMACAAWTLRFVALASLGVCRQVRGAFNRWVEHLAY